MKIGSKQDLLNVLEEIIAPFRDEDIALYNQYCAFYGDKAHKLESFSRLLLGWGPWLKNRKDEIQMNKLLAYIEEGINPESNNYWGMDDDQKYVEMFSILFFLYENKEEVQKDFFNRNRQEIINWFSQINKANIAINNWIFFRLLVNILLYKLELVELDFKEIEKIHDLIDSLYVGNGWYKDGNITRLDYYNSFSFHFYSLIYVKLMKREDFKRSQIYIERAKKFSESFVSFFSKDGTSIPYGRSLIYRFGCAAFWSAVIYSGENICDVGMVKNIIFSNLEWWLKQDIFDYKGYMNVGYCYHNELMTESYNGYASSYWALKIFLILYLDDDNKFWAIERKKAKPKSFQDEFHIVKVHKNNNILFPVPECEDYYEFTHFQDKYVKYCYSSLFGFNVSKGGVSIDQIGIDSNLAVSFDDKYYLMRAYVSSRILKKDIIESIWSIDKDTSITSYVICGNPWHLRIHVVNSVRDIFLVDGGFPIEHRNLNITSTRKRIDVYNDTQAISGFSVLGNGVPKLVRMMPNSHLYFRQTDIVSIDYYIKAGRYVIADAFFGSDQSEYNQIPKVEVHSKYIKVIFNNTEYLIEDREKLKVAGNMELNILKRFKKAYYYVKKRL